MAEDKRTAPANTEAERCILGALLLDWRSMDEAASALNEDDFLDTRNALIWQSLISIYERGASADLLILVDELKRKLCIDKAGGVPYISGLTSVVPTAANIMYYVGIVQDCSKKRKLVRLAQEIRESCLEGKKKGGEIIEDAEQGLYSMSYSGDAQYCAMNELVPEVISCIDRRLQRGGVLSGIPSGFERLDALTSGFQNSELTVIGARPSMGKTALAISFLCHISVKNKIPAGFFSLEMSRELIGDRLMSRTSGVGMSRIRSGVFTNRHLERIRQAADELYASPIYICDKPGMKIFEIRAVARRLVAKHGVRILFIDYMGLIASPLDGRPVYEQQSYVSKMLKCLARELRIPVVALCQVARSAEGSEPTLAELRGSGSIEQDADTVMFIHGDRAGGQSGEEAPAALDRKLIVAKQRNGPVGSVDVLFTAKTASFSDK